MTDPYREATRHERTGLSTVAKVFLIGGGLLAASVVALVIWASVAVDRMVEDIAKAVEEVSLEVSPEVIAAGAVAVDAVTTELAEQREGAVRTGHSVAPKLATAMATALDAMVTEHGFSARADEGSRLAFSVVPPDGNRFGMSFPGATEVLDKVALGELRFADVNRDRRALNGREPDWVPIHPEARRYGSSFFGRADFSLGVTMLLADAGAPELLDWYKKEADRAELGLASVLITSPRDAAGETQTASRLDVHRFAAISKDRFLMVLVTEDGYGDSLLVVMYKSEGRTG